MAKLYQNLADLWCNFLMLVYLKDYSKLRALPLLKFSRARARAVLHGLKIGYRLIDTARLYANEREVGQAIRQSGIDREQLFVTTKVWNDDHGVQSDQDACNSSLRRLGLSYLDLFLIHWPVENLRLDTWKGLEKLLSNGKCRAIGVSNYTIEHIKELLENSSITPAVNQVEFSP